VPSLSSVYAAVDAITLFLPTLLTWSRVNIVSSCRESPETNWDEDFLLLSDVFPTAYHATEPIDCKGGLFAFFYGRHEPLSSPAMQRIPCFRHLGPRESPF
jgi:hypothetical protein